MSMLNTSQMRIFRQIIYMQKSTIGKIAQSTGMHRQSVKIILKSLMEKGLIDIEKQGNKQLYYPKNLSEIKNNYLSELAKIKKHVPELALHYEETKDSQIINSLTGKLGLRTVLLDEIIKGQEILSFHLGPSRQEFEEEYRLNDVRRESLKIPLKVLSAFKPKELPLSETKRINKKSKIDIFVYANKVAIVYDNIESKIFTIKINEVTNLFRDIFNNHWRK